MTIIEALAHIALAGALYLFIPVLLIHRWRKSRRLADVSPSSTFSNPDVTILFAAKNEETQIGETLRSIRLQDYSALSAVAINDRSEDHTRAILDQEAERNEDLTVLHVENLPAGWLGKCHALWKGSAEAQGEWLLFTDADVEFDPHVVRLAVAAAQKYQADHLVLFPQLLWKSLSEASLLTFFTMMLGVGFKFWRVESGSMNAWVGIGAFNMIRRDLYDSFHGHEALRLEIADDMKLGYLAKKHGGKSVAMYSDGCVRVRWRQGTMDIVRGIIRSGFAGMNFNWFRLVFAVAGLALAFLAPFVLLLVADNLITYMEAILSIVLLASAMMLTAQSQGFPARSVLLYPLSVGLFLYGLLISGFTTVVHGGVGWRDTFYSIKELKKGTVR